MNSSRISSLNGIRGFAILLVLLSHASNAGVSINPALNFSGAGRYGVFLFFVLSAFLLTRQFLEKNKNESLKPMLSHYFLRRFIRIYPLFFLSLCIYYILTEYGIDAIVITSDILIDSLLLKDGRAVFWTIPVEFQYYFILPVVALLLRNTDNLIYVLVSTVLFIAIWWHYFPPEYVINVIPFLPIFLLGSVTAYISQRITSINTNKKIADYYLFKLIGLFSFIAFFALVPQFYNLIFSTSVSHTEHHTKFLLFSILSCGLIISVTHSNNLLTKLMNSTFMGFMGKISFSAYLLHKIVLYFVASYSFRSEIKWFLFMTITITLAHISYKYFELPLTKIHNIRTLLNKFNRIYSKT